jgi:hypothetical protein
VKAPRLGLALALGVVGAAALAPGRAFAQLPEGYEVVSTESPQHWAFELKFGPYRPDVDDEFGGTKTPYKDIFGSGQHFYMQSELDYQLWHGYGSLAVGGQIGYQAQTGHALEIVGGMVTNTPSPVDTTTLYLMPLAALAVYRWDIPWKRWSVPLVPFGKLGLAYDLWWITAGDGSIATAQGGKGQGATTGWIGALGLGLLLDWADPGDAKALDADIGINHTYINFEYQHAAVNDFGGSHALNVGDDSWNLGLGFEF